MFKNWVIVLIGVVYVLVRALGKCFGATASSKMMKCEPVIQKYLGITLLPQAGVALGMSLTVINDGVLGGDGELVRNITLFAVLVYELVGPMLTKIALTKAGEIVPKAEAAAVASTEEDDD